ncbi:MAG: DUF222 domain-containing protein [Marmoricola sp.]
MTTPLLLDPAVQLHRCLDEVSACDVDALGPAGQAELLRSIARAEARLAALRSRVLVGAERSRAAALSGAASTGQWAAQVSNADQATAQRQMGLARGLERRTETQAALAAGVILPEHASVIVQADRQLPRSVTAEQRAIVEHTLVEKAQHLPPAQLRRAARRALEAVEPDPVVVDAHENDLVREREEHARSRVRLTLHDNEDGTVTGHFTVPVMQGDLLRKILQTMTAPRRARLGATRAQGGDPEERLDPDRARGLAFCELVEHLPTDHLHSRTAATLVVTVSLDALQGALKVAHLDTNESLSAGEVRRLACTSGLVPAVLGGQSVPLDLGREARLFSGGQRTAVGLKHQTCAADGCDRPFSWCELHHEVPWAAGGRTDLERAIPLCHFHHQRIHDPSFRHTRLPSGGVRFHQRT